MEGKKVVKQSRRGKEELRVKVLKKVQRETDKKYTEERQKMLAEVFANMEEMKKTFRRIYGPHNWPSYNSATKTFNRPVSLSELDKTYNNNQQVQVNSNSRKRKRDESEENETENYSQNHQNKRYRGFYNPPEYRHERNEQQQSSSPKHKSKKSKQNNKKN
jgi:hypothetical protein